MYHSLRSLLDFVHAVPLVYYVFPLCPLETALLIPDCTEMTPPTLTPGKANHSLLYTSSHLATHLPFNTSHLLHNDRTVYQSSYMALVSRRVIHVYTCSQCTYPWKSRRQGKRKRQIKGLLGPQYLMSQKYRKGERYLCNV